MDNRRVVMTRSFSSYGEAVVNSQFEDYKLFILYRKEYNYITGSVEGSLLLQQIVFRWRGNGKKPFYKFREECDHPLYRDGDSWTEEMGFGTSQFDRALKDIATKVTSGSKKSEIEKWSLVTYWTDHQRVTWYSVNERLLNILVGFAYTDQENARKFKLGEILGKWQSPSYLENAESATDTFEHAIYLLYKEYSENTSNTQGDFSNEQELQDEENIPQPTGAEILDGFGFTPKATQPQGDEPKVDWADKEQRNAALIASRQKALQRHSESPWLDVGSWLTPRQGITKEDMQHTLWLLMKTVGLQEPSSDSLRKRWPEHLAAMYTEAGGKWKLLEAAFGKIRDTDEKYRGDISKWAERYILAERKEKTNIQAWRAR